MDLPGGGRLVHPAGSVLIVPRPADAPERRILRVIDSEEAFEDCGEFEWDL